MQGRSSIELSISQDLILGIGDTTPISLVTASPGSLMVSPVNVSWQEHLPFCTLMLVLKGTSVQHPLTQALTISWLTVAPTESFRRGMKQKKPTLTKSGSTKATQPTETVWEESILLMLSMRLHSTSSCSKSLLHSSYIRVISCS